jgi:drug/metabolite transporter (DMT)-like permease
LKERTNKYEWIALVVSILGLVVIYWNGISFQSGNDLLGINLGLGSALFYALIIIFFRLTSQRGLTISTISFWRYIFSVVMLIPVTILLGGFNLTHQDFVPLVVFGVIFAVIASAIHIFGMIQTRALHASILGKSEPVIAILYGVIFLNEIPSVQVIVGGILIIGAGVWLAFLSPKLSG